MPDLMPEMKPPAEVVAQASPKPEAKPSTPKPPEAAPKDNAAKVLSVDEVIADAGDLSKDNARGVLKKIADSGFPTPAREGDSRNAGLQGSDGEIGIQTAVETPVGAAAPAETGIPTGDTPKEQPAETGTPTGNTPKETPELTAEQRQRVDALLRDVGKTLLDIRDPRLYAVALARMGGDTPIADQYRSLVLKSIVDSRDKMDFSTAGNIKKAEAKGTLDRIAATEDLPQIQKFSESPLAGFMRKNGFDENALTAMDSGDVQSTADAFDQLIHGGGDEDRKKAERLAKDLWKEMSGSEGKPYPKKTDAKAWATALTAMPGASAEATDVAAMKDYMDAQKAMSRPDTDMRTAVLTDAYYIMTVVQLLGSFLGDDGSAQQGHGGGH